MAVYTAPEPSANSWGGGKPAGGGVWSTFSLDPTKGELLASVANPAPDFEPHARSGDNLYTNSVVDLDANTGRLNWYYQQEPRDDHDWDLGSAPTVYRAPSGKDMVVVAGKNGYSSASIAEQGRWCSRPPERRSLRTARCRKN